MTMSIPIQNGQIPNLDIQKAIPLNLLTKGMDFDSILGKAMASVQGAESSTQFQIQKKKSKKLDLDAMDPNSPILAQAGVAGAAATADPRVLNRVPLQLFLDKAVKALNNLSSQEFRMNDLIEQFIDGTASEDEVIVETAKLNLSMQMVTTITQSVVQSFKEILQIAV